MTTDIDATDFRVAAAALEHFDDHVDDVADPVVDGIGDTVLEHVRQARRRHHRTGKGERFVTLQAKGAGVHRVVRVHAGGRVAHLLTGGTRPHTIRARTHALPIAPHGGQAVAFAASVRHPGTKADPFVARGVAAASADIDRLAAAGADELARDLAADMRS